MGGSTQRESSLEPAVASDLRTTTIPETGWWFIACKFSPGTTRYLRVERKAKRPLIVPFNSGVPFVGYATETAGDASIGITVAATGIFTRQVSSLNRGISIWLERGDRFLLINAAGATVATDTWKFSLINVKFLPFTSYWFDDTAIP